MHNLCDLWKKLEMEELLLFEREADFNNDPYRYVEISKGLKIIKLSEYAMLVPFWTFVISVIAPYLLYKFGFSNLIVNTVVVLLLVSITSIEIKNRNRLILYKSTWKEFNIVFIGVSLLNIVSTIGALFIGQPLEDTWYEALFNPRFNYMGLAIIYALVMTMRLLIFTFERIRYNRKYARRV